MVTSLGHEAVAASTILGVDFSDSLFKRAFEQILRHSMFSSRRNPSKHPTSSRKGTVSPSLHDVNHWNLVFSTSTRVCESPTDQVYNKGAVHGTNVADLCEFRRSKSWIIFWVSLMFGLTSPLFSSTESLASWQVRGPNLKWHGI